MHRFVFWKCTCASNARVCHTRNNTVSLLIESCAPFEPASNETTRIQMLRCVSKTKILKYLTSDICFCAVQARFEFCIEWGCRLELEVLSPGLSLGSRLKLWREVQRFAQISREAGSARGHVWTVTDRNPHAARNQNDIWKKGYIGTSGLLWDFFL